MTRLANILAVTILLMGGITQAHAGVLEDGLSAYARGDYVTALTLLRPLADGGNVNAQNTLGIMYANGGNGMVQDYAEAHKWYQLAANLGHARAQANLGIMYYNGDSVPKDFVEACKWFTLAYAGGFVDAARYRSLVEETMTEEQIAEARRRAAALKETSQKK